MELGLTYPWSGLALVHRDTYLLDPRIMEALEAALPGASPEDIAQAVEDYLTAHPSAAVWGAITGDLADQGDLAAALADLAADIASKADTSALAGYATDGELTGGLAGKSDTGHGHTISDVTNLQTTLDGKQPTGSYSVEGHTHTQTDVTGLTSALSGKLDTSAAPELIRDTIATALVAGANVTITPNDAGDIITIAATGGGGGITTEDAVDAVATALTATGNLSKNYNDAGDTLTLDVPGVPTYISTTEPAAAGPLLWIKDLGSGNYAIAVKVP